MTAVRLQSPFLSRERCGELTDHGGEQLRFASIASDTCCGANRSQVTEWSQQGQLLAPSVTGCQRVHDPMAASRESVARRSSPSPSYMPPEPLFPPSRAGIAPALRESNSRGSLPPEPPFLHAMSLDEDMLLSTALHAFLPRRVCLPHEIFPSVASSAGSGIGAHRFSGNGAGGLAQHSQEDTGMDLRRVVGEHAAPRMMSEDCAASNAAATTFASAAAGGSMHFHTRAADDWARRDACMHYACVGEDGSANVGTLKAVSPGRSCRRAFARWRWLSRARAHRVAALCEARMLAARGRAALLFWREVVQVRAAAALVRRLDGAGAWLEARRASSASASASPPYPFLPPQPRSCGKLKSSPQTSASSFCASGAYAPSVAHRNTYGDLEPISSRNERAELSRERVQEDSRRNGSVDAREENAMRAVRQARAVAWRCMHRWRAYAQDRCSWRHACAIRAAQLRHWRRSVLATAAFSLKAHQALTLALTRWRWHGISARLDRAVLSVIRESSRRQLRAVVSSWSLRARRRRFLLRSRSAELFRGLGRFLLNARIVRVAAAAAISNSISTCEFDDFVRLRRMGAAVLKWGQLAREATNCARWRSSKRRLLLARDLTKWATLARCRRSLIAASASTIQRRLEAAWATWLNLWRSRLPAPLHRRLPNLGRRRRRSASGRAAASTKSAFLTEAARGRILSSRALHALRAWRDLARVSQEMRISHAKMTEFVNISAVRLLFRAWQHFVVRCDFSARGHRACQLVVRQRSFCCWKARVATESAVRVRLHSLASAPATVVRSRRQSNALLALAAAASWRRSVASVTRHVEMMRLHAAFDIWIQASVNGAALRDRWSHSERASREHGCASALSRWRGYAQTTKMRTRHRYKTILTRLFDALRTWSDVAVAAAAMKACVHGANARFAAQKCASAFFVWRAASRSELGLSQSSERFKLVLKQASFRRWRQSAVRSLEMQASTHAATFEAQARKPRRAFGRWRLCMSASRSRDLAARRFLFCRILCRWRVHNAASRSAYELGARSLLHHIRSSLARWQRLSNQRALASLLASDKSLALAASQQRAAATAAAAAAAAVAAAFECWRPRALFMQPLRRASRLASRKRLCGLFGQWRTVVAANVVRVRTISTVRRRLMVAALACWARAARACITRFLNLQTAGLGFRRFRRAVDALMQQSSELRGCLELCRARRLARSMRVFRQRCAISRVEMQIRRATIKGAVSELRANLVERNRSRQLVCTLVRIRGRRLTSSAFLRWLEISAHRARLSALLDGANCRSALIACWRRWGALRMHSHAVRLAQKTNWLKVMAVWFADLHAAAAAARRRGESFASASSRVIGRRRVRALQRALVAWCSYLLTQRRSLEFVAVRTSVLLSTAASAGSFQLELSGKQNWRSTLLALTRRRRAMRLWSREFHARAAIRNKRTAIMHARMSRALEVARINLARQGGSVKSGTWRSQRLRADAQYHDRHAYPGASSDLQRRRYNHQQHHVLRNNHHGHERAMRSCFLAWAKRSASEVARLCTEHKLRARRLGSLVTQWRHHVRWRQIRIADRHAAIRCGERRLVSRALALLFLNIRRSRRDAARALALPHALVHVGATRLAHALAIWQRQSQAGRLLRMAAILARMAARKPALARWRAWFSRRRASSRLLNLASSRSSRSHLACALRNLRASHAGSAQSSLISKRAAYHARARALRDWQERAHVLRVCAHKLRKARLSHCALLMKRVRNRLNGLQTGVPPEEGTHVLDFYRSWCASLRNAHAAQEQALARAHDRTARPHGSSFCVAAAATPATQRRGGDSARSTALVRAREDDDSPDAEGSQHSVASASTADSTADSSAAISTAASTADHADAQAAESCPAETSASRSAAAAAPAAALSASNSTTGSAATTVAPSPFSVSVSSCYAAFLAFEALRSRPLSLAAAAAANKHSCRRAFRRLAALSAARACLASAATTAIATTITDHTGAFNPTLAARRLRTISSESSFKAMHTVPSVSSRKYSQRTISTPMSATVTCDTDSDSDTDAAVGSCVCGAATSTARSVPTAASRMHPHQHFGTCSSVRPDSDAKQLAQQHAKQDAHANQWTRSLKSPTTATTQTTTASPTTTRPTTALSGTSCLITPGCVKSHPGNAQRAVAHTAARAHSLSSHRQQPPIRKPQRTPAAVGACHDPTLPRLAA